MNETNEVETKTRHSISTSLKTTEIPLQQTSEVLDKIHAIEEDNNNDNMYVECYSL